MIITTNPPQPPPPLSLPYDRSIFSSQASIPESAIQCLRLLQCRLFPPIFPSILEGRSGLFASDFPTETNEPRLSPIRPTCLLHRIILYLITLSCDRTIGCSKTSVPKSVIWCFLFQFPVIFKVIQ